MPIAKETTTIIPVPAGNHLGICIGCVDLGTQPDEMYGARRKVMLSWEIPEEKIDYDGKEVPMVISREYALSLNTKANLRKDLESWRGRPFTSEELAGFDVANVVGKPCMLNVIQATTDGKVRSRVASIASIPKGLAVPPMAHVPIKFDLENGPECEAYKAMPEWVRTKITKCLEWQKPGKNGGANIPPPAEADDVPF